MDLDYDKTYEQLSEVTGIQLTTKDIPSNILKVMLGYEKGEINTETFLWNLQKESKKLTPQPQALIKAWNAMLLGWNPKRFEFLENLRKSYKVFLLSNTNELHIDWVMRDLKKVHGINDFNSRFFDTTFFSHIMNMRKPELSIYNEVGKVAGIDLGESLFIDDNVENVTAARKAGMNAVVHDPSNEIIDMLPIYLENF